MIDELTFFPDIALCAPSVLLPRRQVDLTKWAVIACDQYTSQPEYWEGVRDFVGSAPSTLNLIYPEAYLGKFEQESFIVQLNRRMHEYLEGGILESCQPGLIAVNRRTSYAPSRKGLVAALDLEQYDHTPGAATLIRATEGTVPERVPPRAKIRRHAPLELPHIMVLIDDPEKTVIEPLFKEELPVAYDFELMMNGGRLTGCHVGDERLIKKVAAALHRLAAPEVFAEKYNLSPGRPVMLYAIGDGNHSLAAAKMLWETVKQDNPALKQNLQHPARFALVELVNLHDEGLRFEPIHRVLKNVESRALLTRMENYYRQAKMTFELVEIRSAGEMKLEAGRIRKEAGQAHVFSFCCKGQIGVISIRKPVCNLEVGTLQAFLDGVIAEDPAVEIDYIHGDDMTLELGSREGAVGFLLPAMSKHDLFKTVIIDGALPRKTFSMGEADEKRFYMEARLIC